MAADATALLLAWRQGDEAALDKLIVLVYQELRRMAHRIWPVNAPVTRSRRLPWSHETYLRLVDCRQVRWQDRSHFLAVTAKLMRRILVDYARLRKREQAWRRGPPVSLDESFDFAPPRSPDLWRWTTLWKRWRRSIPARARSWS